MQFTVNLSEDIDDDVTVRYEVLPGTASRSDYTSDSSSGSLTITGTSGTFSVVPVNDTLAENTETFTVRLTLVSPPKNVALGIATKTGTITDDDNVAATVTANQATARGRFGGHVHGRSGRGRRRGKRGGCGHLPHQTPNRRYAASGY